VRVLCHRRPPPLGRPGAGEEGELELPDLKLVAVVDRALLDPLAVNGKVPRSGILVTAEEVYFHCGKALIRSDLWNPEKQLRRSEFPSLGRILADQIGGISVEESERLTAESYRTRLY